MMGAFIFLLAFHAHQEYDDTCITSFWTLYINFISVFFCMCTCHSGLVDAIAYLLGFGLGKENPIYLLK